jgi:hypothetical protein
VVEAEDKDLLGRGDVEERGTEQGAVSEIEGEFNLLADDPTDLGFAVGSGEGAQIDPGETEIGDGRDELHGLAIDRAEGGAEDFMAGDDVGEGAVKEGAVEATGDVEGEGDVIEGAAGVGAINEPEAALGERSGENPCVPGLQVPCFLFWDRVRQDCQIVHPAGGMLQ